jgi:enoyl-CoA hydratase/carnithine racemase
MRYLLTGDEFGASEAHRMGLVQEVTAPGEEFALALGIAERITRHVPLGVRATLASARLALAEGDAAAARRLLPDLQPLMGSEDVKEGVASFLERREANFAGR